MLENGWFDFSTNIQSNYFIEAKKQYQ